MARWKEEKVGVQKEQSFMIGLLEIDETMNQIADKLEKTMVSVSTGSEDKTQEIQNDEARVIVNSGAQSRDKVP